MHCAVFWNSRWMLRFKAALQQPILGKSRSAVANLLLS